MKTLEQLLIQWEAGTASAEDLAELKRRLATPAARAELVSEWLLDEAIYDTLRSQPGEAQAKVPAQVPQRARPRAKTGFARRLFPRLVWHEAHISLRWPLGFAVAVCLLFFGVYTYYEHVPAGQLVRGQSGVIIERGGRRIAAAAGQLLYPGDQVRVPAGGATVLAWSDEPTRLELSGAAELRVRNPLRGKRLELTRGNLQATVASQPRWRPLIITTPQASAEVVGTQFALSAAGTTTRLEVLEGAVRFRKIKPSPADRQTEVLVHAGEVAAVSPGTQLEVQYLTGFLSSEVWAVPPGTSFRDAPKRGTLLIQPYESAALGASRPMERLRGYLVAPATGQFSFWIAPFNADTSAEFWLSSDEQPNHKRRIAYFTASNTVNPPAGQRPAGVGLTAARRADWHRAASQQSSAQWLEKGRRYYVEVWHEGADIRSLLLGWTSPGQIQTDPKTIDPQALAPFVEATAKEGANP